MIFSLNINNIIYLVYNLGMYEKAEEDAIEVQLQERATLFAQELVKVNDFSIQNEFAH